MLSVYPMTEEQQAKAKEFYEKREALIKQLKEAKAEFESFVLSLIDELIPKPEDDIMSSECDSDGPSLKDVDISGDFKFLVQASEED